MMMIESYTDDDIDDVSIIDNIRCGKLPDERTRRFKE